MEYWRCVIDRFWGAAGVMLGISGAVAIAGAISCAVAAATTAEAAFLPCFLTFLAGLGVFLTLSLILILIAAMATCAGGAGTAPISGALPAGFGEGMDCPAVRAALDAALGELASALEDLEDAMAATRKARRRLEAAMIAVGIAIGAVAAAFFRPDLLAAAITALLAALALVSSRAGKLSDAVGKELKARRAVAFIEAKVAALQALVNSLCPRIDTSVSPAPGDEDPGDFVPVDVTPPLT